MIVLVSCSFNNKYMSPLHTLCNISQNYNYAGLLKEIYFRNKQFLDTFVSTCAYQLVNKFSYYEKKLQLQYMQKTFVKQMNPFTAILLQLSRNCCQINEVRNILH